MFKMFSWLCFETFRFFVESVVADDAEDRFEIEFYLADAVKDILAGQVERGIPVFFASLLVKKDVM